MSGQRLVMGVDVGGTKTLAVVVALGAPGTRPEIVDREQVPSDAGSPEVVDAVVTAVRAVRDRVDGTVEALGIGLAGLVDRQGVARRAPNAAGLIDLDVVGRVGSAVGLRTVTDNDANCVAVAAHALVAPEARHLVAVTLGTGIGAGLVVDGRLLRGAEGFAGEPGHMVVDRDGIECPCGQRGCWERYASGSALGRMGREAATAGAAPSLVDAAGSAEAVTGEHVTALAAAGDIAAGEVLDAFADEVALGLANLMVVLDPEVVVVGGGVIAAGERLLDRVRSTLAATYPHAVDRRSVQIVGSPGGPEAGALGAALIAAG
jgi:glucokinase